MLNYTEKTRSILERTKQEKSYRELLTHYGLRATRQRLTVAAQIFDRTDPLIDAETLYEDVALCGNTMSLATIYNTLHHFAKVGLIRPVSCHAQKQLYATARNNSVFFHHTDQNGQAHKISMSAFTPNFKKLPTPPDGYVISNIDIVIHLKTKETKHECAHCKLFQAINNFSAHIKRI
ncbi:Fur family transcriptional regulator [Bartonella tamiae]|uniref:Ferric uptake regulation protein n=1 Tax=Bartonella tamiae Th239 TaxID=1094558 RepID=J1K259_9HYPH|nr:transcriptional repressor [Bartonella tamiae]EJF91180.1 hypothetical protein ME5_00512 [Bartonella tamiae Th239]EJF93155.1 hypothetical protein MEG_01369 [Bartonella tamiae Th307]